MKTTNLSYSEFIDCAFENISSQFASAINAKGGTQIRLSLQTRWTGFRGMR
jgi:hypothetical protein